MAKLVKLYRSDGSSFNEEYYVATDWSIINNKPTNFTPAVHNHDDRYYTEGEVDNKVFLKADTDNRTADTTPDDYNGKFEIKGLKENNILGLSVELEGLFSGLIGVRNWGNYTGGNAHEFALTGNGNIFHRHGATTTWNSWRKIAYKDEIPIVSAWALKPELDQADIPRQIKTPAHPYESNNYSIELFSDDTDDYYKEISIRFYHKSQWYYQLRANGSGFKMTQGSDGTLVKLRALLNANDISEGTLALERLPTIPHTKLSGVINYQELEAILSDYRTAVVADNLYATKTEVDIVRSNVNTLQNETGDLSDRCTALENSLSNKLNTNGTAYNSTRWGNYQIRVGSYSSGASGYITFSY